MRIGAVFHSLNSYLSIPNIGEFFLFEPFVINEIRELFCVMHLSKAKLCCILQKKRRVVKCLIGSNLQCV